MYEHTRSARKLIEVDRPVGTLSSMIFRKLDLQRNPPRNILLLKGASAGIGDLLCSTAAWRALKDRFPQSRLHLWFLTREPGHASEQLIGRHHLLSSFWVSDTRTRK